ncbi:twin-arginine translocase TatA/TatE family subunit [Zooshikella sp. RANM57]|uniref:twin-arginine translocase TatA/TatE family subunit n=1 Tax=Zooshikella sp. RANM57 TaxID=3425863 RepID=UPI003D6F7D4B
MAGISIWQLLIIAIIVILLFGTNKLRTLGSDLGTSIKGFKKALGENEDKQNDLTHSPALAQIKITQPFDTSAQNKQEE